MLVLLGIIAGAATGALVAYRRKGNLADMLQYGFVYGMIFALAGLFLTLIIHRLMV